MKPGMRGLFRWTWSWGIGWHRQPPSHPLVYLTDSAAKAFGSLCLLLTVGSQAVALAGLLAYGAGQAPAAVEWAYASDDETLAWTGVVALPAFAFLVAALVWWSPRNPTSLHDWLRRRKAKKLRRAQSQRPGASKPKGRPPHAGTVALRRRLDADMAHGQMATTQEYVEWLLATDPAIGRNVAYSIVHRELQRRK